MFSSDKWFGASPSFYNGVVTQSARFNDGSSAYLHRTPSGAGNQKTWTFSTWIKKTENGDTQQILSIGNTSTSPWFLMYFSTDDKINVYWYNGSSVNANQTFTPVLRDTSAWYNIVLRMDTTQGTDTNRLKIYVNGVQETSFSSTGAGYPSQNRSNTYTLFRGERDLQVEIANGFDAQANGGSGHNGMTQVGDSTGGGNMTYMIQ